MRGLPFYGWVPVSLEPEAAALYLAKLEEVLASWQGTRYWPGQCSKGVGVDCVRFVCSVIDELSGKSHEEEVSTLPQDSAMHNRAGAIATMRTIKNRFRPIKKITDGSLEPGDIVVTGPVDGGPGHGMIVGPRKNEIWHATHTRVQRTGVSVISKGKDQIFAVYRCQDRDQWVGE